MEIRHIPLGLRQLTAWQREADGAHPFCLLAVRRPTPHNYQFHQIDLPCLCSFLGPFSGDETGGGRAAEHGLSENLRSISAATTKDLLYFSRIPAAFLCHESLTRCDRVLRLIWGDRLEFSPDSPQHYWTTQNHTAVEKQNVCIYAGRVGGKYCIGSWVTMQSFMCSMYLLAHQFLCFYSICVKW